MTSSDSATLFRSVVSFETVFFLASTWCSLGIGGNAPAKKTWDFETVEPGALPEHFSARTGAWKVRADSASAKANRVLTQSGKSDKPVFNLCLVQGTRFQDVELRVRIRAVSGEIDQGGGVVWRAKDEENYYLCRFNPLEKNFRVYKVETGQRVQLATAVVEKHESWSNLRIVMRADRIQCFLEAKLLLDVRDSTFTEPGMIGLWTKADAVTDFDDLAVGPPWPDSMAP